MTQPFLGMVLAYLNHHLLNAGMALQFLGIKVVVQNPKYFAGIIL
jgi:hypothetical protein